MVEKYYPSYFIKQELVALERKLKHFVVDAHQNGDQLLLSMPFLSYRSSKQG
jgi:hypothetical protein